VRFILVFLFLSFSDPWSCLECISETANSTDSMYSGLLIACVIDLLMACVWLTPIYIVIYYYCGCENYKYIYRDLNRDWSSKKYMYLSISFFFTITDNQKPEWRNFFPGVYFFSTSIVHYAMLVLTVHQSKYIYFRNVFNFYNL
jgi:hypothetical protein